MSNRDLGKLYNGMFEAYIPHFDQLQLNESFDEVREFDPMSYTLEGGTAAITHKQHTIYVGKGIVLLDSIAVNMATEDEIYRVIKYLMVAIDGFKHKLDVKRAFKDFGINELTDKYVDFDKNGNRFGGLNERVKHMRDEGFSEAEISKFFGMPISSFRVWRRTWNDIRNNNLSYNEAEKA